MIDSHCYITPRIIRKLIFVNFRNTLYNIKSIDFSKSDLKLKSSLNVKTSKAVHIVRFSLHMWKIDSIDTLRKLSSSSGPGGFKKYIILWPTIVYRFIMFIPKFFSTWSWHTRNIFFIIIFWTSLCVSLPLLTVLFRFALSWRPVFKIYTFLENHEHASDHPSKFAEQHSIFIYVQKKTVDNRDGFI